MKRKRHVDRKQEEMAFHDQRERDHRSMTEEEWRAKYSNKKWYLVTEKSDRYFDDWITQNCQGKTALDFGCGLGGTSLKLAKAGAMVHAIDISPESVNTTRDLLVANGFGDRIKAEVMDAEGTKFPDSFFDIVICAGVLHHMDVTKAFPEIARILKPTGTVMAAEALGYNPIINLYRRMTPKLRTAWEVDHILTMRELKIARQSFNTEKVKFFHLLAIGGVVFHNTFVFKPMLSMLNAIDDIILRIPGFQLMAWQMIFFLSNPKKS